MRLARPAAGADAPGDAYGVYYFRRTLDLPTAPSRLVVRRRTRRGHAPAGLPGTFLRRGREVPLHTGRP